MHVRVMQLTPGQCTADDLLSTIGSDLAPLMWSGAPRGWSPITR